MKAAQQWRSFSGHCLKHSCLGRVTRHPANPDLTVKPMRGQDLEANLAATEAAAQAGEEQREAADTRCCALKEGVAALWARVGPRQVSFIP